MLERRKDTQGAFRKPTSIIRHRYALEECVRNGCIYSSVASTICR